MYTEKTKKRVSGTCLKFVKSCVGRLVLFDVKYGQRENSLPFLIADNEEEIYHSCFLGLLCCFSDGTTTHACGNVSYGA